MVAVNTEFSKFGKLAGRVTAENQLAQYEYNQYGLTESIEKTLADAHDPVQEIKYSYDEFDRVTKIDYGNNEIKTFKYDNRSKILSIETFEKEKAAYKTDFSYDEFDRVSKKVISKLSSKEAEKTVYTYKYTNTGKLLAEKISFPDGTERNIKRFYDKFGRLTEIKDSDKSVTYTYDKNSKLASQAINGVPVTYSYTKYGQLESKVMGDAKKPIASLSYSYTKDGRISARLINGVMQNFEYDVKGQLLKVVDAGGNVLENYEYDKAGNILKKVVNSNTTTFTYDKANQLVSAILPDGSVKKYAYDAAGRMISETGDAEAKTYTYGWLNKVTKLETGTTQSTFTYFPGGQLAEKITANDTEKFYWDGLALIKRDSVEYTNEPSVAGGNPIMTNSEVLFNDMLGNSTGAYSEERFRPINRTSFGEAVGKIDDDINFFTGKPNVEGLGYNFLFRNYRPEIGKWQTSDPIGYPDGWNNLAYINNKVTAYIDQLGWKKYFVLNDLEMTYQAGIDQQEGEDDIYILTASIRLYPSGNKTTTATLGFVSEFVLDGVLYGDDIGDILSNSIVIKNPDNPYISSSKSFSRNENYYTMQVSMEIISSGATSVTLSINWSVIIDEAFANFETPPAVSGLFMYSFGIKEYAE